jgi:hypothetical protein
MSTDRQRNASRANGSKSRSLTGPLYGGLSAVTPEGKLVSSRNATTHGLLSATVVLKGESTDRFEKLLAALYEEFQPETPFEESLIENMAAARWRQRRIWSLEKAAMDHEVRRQADLSNLSSTDDNTTRASLAFRTLSDDSRSLELINRYDSRCERQYYRAHRRFLEVRDRRTPPPASPSASVEISKRTPEVIANEPIPIDGRRPPAQERIVARLSGALSAFICVHRRLIAGLLPKSWAFDTIKC